MSSQLVLLLISLLALGALGIPLILFRLPNPTLNIESEKQKEKAQRLKVWAVENQLTPLSDEDIKRMWETLGFYQKYLSKPTSGLVSTFKKTEIKIFEFDRIINTNNSYSTHNITVILLSFSDYFFPDFMIIPKREAYPFHFRLLDHQATPKWANDKLHFAFHKDQRSAFREFISEIDGLPDYVFSDTFQTIYGSQNSICLVQGGEIMTNISHYQWLESIAHEFIDAFRIPNARVNPELMIKTLKENEQD